MTKTVYQYHRQRKASPVTLLIVSIGLMFVIGGIVRFVIGPGDQIFFDGERLSYQQEILKKLPDLVRDWHSNYPSDNSLYRIYCCFYNPMVF